VGNSIADPGDRANGGLEKGEKQPLETFCTQPETPVDFPYFHRP
jgi:hypothetical protein